MPFFCAVGISFWELSTIWTGIMMFAILLFPYKCICSHITSFIYYSYCISNISFRKKKKHVRIVQVMLWQQTNPIAEYHNIMSQLVSMRKLHFIDMFNVCKAPGQLLYMWWLSDRSQPDSVPWCLGHPDTSLFATAGHRERCFLLLPRRHTHFLQSPFIGQSVVLSDWRHLECLFSSVRNEDK